MSESRVETFGSRIRARVAASLRSHRHRAFSYARTFGVRRGLAAALKVSAMRRGFLRLSIPQSRSRIAVRGGTSDVQTFEQVFLANESDYSFEPRKTPRVIVDGGANAGYASIYFANRFPDAHIIAIEPEASNFELLSLNTADYPNVRLVRSGLWSRRTVLKIENPSEAHWAFRVDEGEGAEAIPAITMEDVLELSPTGAVDILKLDIEGAEREVFRGDPKWLERVDALIVELHDRVRPGCSELVLSAAARYGFQTTFRGEHVILTRSPLLEAGRRARGEQVGSSGRI